jgi:hypothetical protein
VCIEDIALRVGVRLAPIRGSLAEDKIVPRGGGVSLSDNPLLAEISLPSSTTFATVCALLFPLALALLHEARQKLPLAELTYR